MEKSKNKKFKVIVKRVLIELEKRIEYHSDNCNKMLENIKMNQSELKNKYNN